LQLVGPDGQKIEWMLGSVNAWFREGTKEKNNQGISPEYQLPRSEIIATFPPSEKNRHSKKSPFAIAVTGILLAAFVYYLVQQCRFGNMQRLDFLGVLFIVNLLVLIGLIFAFWLFFINLVQFLQILAAYSPVALFLFNRGLMAGNANCKLE